ncbi:MarR family winged helix-turn-helix transcriptional regulator [Corynebacterium sp. TAE3-ERU12]|uniref:MarR family winged helix-turn-helix transcriptional regulator n=1 Tax=Corynebacterium sp. TAE3-ERU12 TaxID=2849491 RepID=UPI001C468D6E|nr:MarR family winged helix-turn-helix transcriptional regulator [Corynebacterium sp. TAE3-ERU12]MBV7295968.1 MarR family winged helix-turn-helix transcriptional regulator [Corynebacterium sp. TAE3-ERU12]
MASNTNTVLSKDMDRVVCAEGGDISLDPATRADVQRVASGIYDFLAATRRLGERPNQRLEISQSEMEILHFVSRHPGCGVSDIARLRFLRPSNVSATVRRLLDNELLLRENNAHDRRAQDLYISDNGKEMLTRVSEHWGEIISRIVSTMDINDVRVLVKAVPSLLKLTEHSEVFVEEHQRRQQNL